MHPKIVIDTNILLVSISPKSQYHWVFQKFIDKEYTLCVTTDKHFNVLKEVKFPKVNLINMEEFEEIVRREENRS